MTWRVSDLIAAAPVTGALAEGDMLDLGGRSAHRLAYSWTFARIVSVFLDSGDRLPYSAPTP